jgi:hypothetical protein
MGLARLGDRRPTVRQIYALAAALCERQGEEFPETFVAASELIERLRLEAGHPAPRLVDTAPAPRRARRRGRGTRVARGGRFGELMLEEVVGRDDVRQHSHN